MFLAWSEMKRNKLRFLLITSILLLVSFLVFFLSGLATGLANLNREAVDKWGAAAIVLAEDADKSLYQSTIDLEELGDWNAKETAVIGQLGTIANNGKVKQNVALMGIRPDEFAMPKATEGDVFSKKFEVVAADVLKDDGFQIGDTLNLSSSDEELTIVGFTDQARFNAAPVLYMNLSDLQQLKFGEAAEQNEQLVNAIAVQGAGWNQLTAPDDTELIEIETFIENLPGYTEQNMTLTFMIYFLFVISSAIVAIFLYVLTVQKISVFGIMKAQGISSGYLSRSVVAQTFLLAAIGVLLGFGLTILAGQFLPSAVPVQFDIGTMLIYGAVLIAVAILGAVISIWTIVKIDPLEAIGG